MVDIFISYAREDLERARRLVEALEHRGWSVFWDRTIPSGKTWRQVIGTALADARCLVVLWSRHSVESTWVIEEADRGLERGILVPALIDMVRPPLGYGGIQAADLSLWKGGSTDPALRSLFDDVATVLARTPKAKSRVREKAKGGKAGARSATLSRVLATALGVGLIAWMFGGALIGPAPFEQLRPPTAGPALSGAVSPGVADPRTHHSPGESFQDCLDVCPELVVIPGGHFIMGSPVTENDRFSVEGPQHEVTVRSFAIGRFEITRGQYLIFVRATGRAWNPPPFPQTDADPAVNVGWNDARQYAGWLSEMTGQRYRLPTEAEWEYAARAGTMTARYWGDNANDSCAFANGWDDAQPCRDGFATTAPVGRFAPNGFGLHDMLGNAMGWTGDCWSDYQPMPRDGSVLVGDCGRGVIARGGSWRTIPAAVRSAARAAFTPDGGDASGFRIARTL